MAQAGIVQTLSGSVFARTPQGQVRELKVGDLVFENELIETSNASHIVIALQNGNTINLVENSKILIDETVLGKVEEYDAIVHDVDVLQNALENGQDISELEEETAVGEMDDSYDYTVDYYAGDNSSGQVGSYLIDVDTAFDNETFDPFIINDNAADQTITPEPAIYLDASVTADDIINATEAGGTIAVTGTVVGNIADGETVTLTVNGNDYTGIVTDGKFSINVAGSDLRDDANHEIEASVTITDEAGNVITATATEGYAVDTTVSASISLNADITADNIINAAEAGTDITITGIVGGDVQDGDIVTLTVNGNDYTGTVSSGAFSINVAGSDLAADVDTTIQASVTTTDAAGNSVTVTATDSYSVDTTSSATISLDSNITADDIVNAAEASGNITVSGTVAGDAEAGDSVSFTVNGTDYATTVNLDGSTWSVAVAGSDLAAQTSFDVTVSGSDAAGNPFAATTTSVHTVDTTSAASIAVNAITADDIINAAEASANITVSGTVTGDAEAGDHISFTVNGTAYNTTVNADATWSVSVAGSDLAAQTSFDVTVSGSDSAGNPFTVTATSVHALDTTSTASITVNAITVDDIVNAAEAGANIVITGTVGGDVHDGDTVTLTVNGHNYTGTVS